MTDALAEWFLAEHEAGRHPVAGAGANARRTTSPAGWPRPRADGHLRNDDVTLLVIDVDTAGGSTLHELADYPRTTTRPSRTRAISFADPDLKGGEVVVNALGLPVPRSGNFADVYQFTGADGKQWALKCFTRKVAGLRERYAKIDEHLAKARLPFTVGFKFFEKGIRVRGRVVPAPEDGVGRGVHPQRVRRPATWASRTTCTRLMQMWAKLAGRLRDANMAHADLQHGNVLLVPGSDAAEARR